MRALSYLVVVVIAIAMIALLVVAGVWMVQAGSRRRRERRRAARLAEARRTTPWQPYCRVDDETGAWRYGVERVCPFDDDVVKLGRYEMGTLPPAASAVDVMTAEGAAIAQAGQYNVTRQGMGD